MRRKVLIFGILATLGVGVGMAAAGWYYLDQFMYRHSALAQPTVVEVKPGMGMAEIAANLAEHGIITDALLFRLGARLSGRDRGLKAGEFEFPAGISPVQVLGLLEAGKVVQHRITVNEGLTVREAFDILEQDQVLVGRLPDLPAEGALFPETYFFLRGETRRGMVDRMRSEMQDALNEAWQDRDIDLPLENTDQVLILASIIEKETSVAEEYPIVAGVFVNRLRKGMLLQTDPTVIYALTEGDGPLGRRLTRKDLKVESPYNTYLNGGLPPGPIASPSRAAIEAAVRPADTPFFYFVADGTGGHAFAETLKEHNRNVAKWRKVRDAQN